ncbi:radical SAM protein [Candidatus Woesearchaeota archaeon]|nr:radical SAM protein [Candidatus Woesearchaeota archaeon]
MVLNRDLDRLVGHALPAYSRILKGEGRPRFKELGSVLDGKTEAAFALLEDCVLCERECHADRTAGEPTYCRSGSGLSVAGHVQFDDGDLSFLLPSYAVFFLGCTVQCVYCQNWENSMGVAKKDRITEKRLARAIDLHRDCRNIDFVGGEPVPQLPFVLKTLGFVKRDVPVMWHSNFYASEVAMGLLEGVVDVYSPTFKYGNDDCAKRLSKADDYTCIVRRNLLFAAQDSDVLVRHLVLPNHLECCSRPVIDFIADNFGDSVLVHLMSQYEPVWKAAHFKDISRPLRQKEFREVVRYAKQKGLSYVAD